MRTPFESGRKFLCFKRIRGPFEGSCITCTISFLCVEAKFWEKRYSLWLRRVVGGLVCCRIQGFSLLVVARACIACLALICYCDRDEMTSSFSDFASGLVFCVISGPSPHSSLSTLCSPIPHSSSTVSCSTSSISSFTSAMCVLHVLLSSSPSSSEQRAWPDLSSRAGGPLTTILDAEVKALMLVLARRVNVNISALW